MNKGILGGAVLTVAGIVLSTLPQAHGDVVVNWDFDDGFSPVTVSVTAGESVIWQNVDPFGFDVSVTVDGVQTFFLPNLNAHGVVFSTRGTYGFHSDFGDNGSVVVDYATSPSLVLDAFRVEGSRLLINASGLSEGATNILESTVNFKVWTPVSTNVAPDSTMTLTNSISPTPMFYRLIELPLPVLNG